MVSEVTGQGVDRRDRCSHGAEVHGVCSSGEGGDRLGLWLSGGGAVKTGPVEADSLPLDGNPARAREMEIFPAQTERERKLHTVALAIAAGQWKGRTSVLAFAARWGTSATYVSEIARDAAVLVRADRGTLLAHAEQSIAVALARRDENLRLARAHRDEASTCERARDKSDLLRVAVLEERAALDWQDHADHVAGAKAPPTQIAILMHDPRWQRLYSAVATALQPYPEARVAVDAALAALDGGT